MSVNDNTFPRPNEAFQQHKIELNSKIDLEMMQENKSKILQQNIVTNNINASYDTTNVSIDNMTMKTPKKG
jgi:hypothetical protein